MRFLYDLLKSKALKSNPARAIGFEEAREIWLRPYYLDQRSEVPEQWRAIGWVGDRLFTVIYEERKDDLGEYVHLVTLWRSTKEERALYEKHS
jgi:uncharacterized DUF497 family protein